MRCGMKDDLYAYGDARVRCHEASLLTRSFLESLIASSGMEEAFALLGSHGWSLPEDLDRNRLLSDREEQVWEEVKELVKDGNVLDLLTVKNDFYNLKAALSRLEKFVTRLRGII